MATVTQSDFTILLFDWDDTVSVAHLIRANSPERAMSIADVMALAYPRLAGYQLWQDGRRIGSTFPQTETDAHPPVAAVVETALKRRAN